MAGAARMRYEITRGNARRDGLMWQCLPLKGWLAYSLGGFVASSGSRNNDVHINLTSMVAKDHFSFSSFLSLRTSHLSMEIELLDLAQSNEALREDLPKRAIKEYKELPGFEMGLVRMGRVSLEYGYQLALTRF
ncbi:hypothetical protein BHE74_00003465 [Ensete ventricosum]|nr:hypothetical protein BHE74_00003465 [Ensete ventricosum]